MNSHVRHFRIIIFFFISLFFVIPSVSVNYAQDWQEIEDPNSPEARYGHSLVTLPDGRVVMFGGQGENDILFNDLNIFRDTWQPETPLNDPPSARKNHVAWSDSDKVYIFGGNDNSTLLNDLWSYDLSTKSWSQLQPSGTPPDPRESTSAFKYNGDLYLIGGEGESSRMSDVWYYNIQENSWNKWGHSPASIAGTAAFIYGDNLFISGSSSWTMAADLTSMQWRDFQSTPMPSPRSYAGCAQTSTTGFLVGGEGSVLQDTWSFDFASESWTQLADLPTPLKYVGAAIYENQILIFGGIKEDSTLGTKTMGYAFEPSDVDEQLGYGFYLEQNYPNPFNPSTIIEFSILKSAFTTLKIFDALGGEIKTLLNEEKVPGNYIINFDASLLSSGIYFYKLTAGEYTAMKKMMFIK